MAKTERDQYLGMKGVRRLVKRINQSNEEASATAYPGLPWPEGKTASQLVEISKQIRPMLRDNLRYGEWQTEDIDELFAEANLIQAEYAEIGKPSRHSGEDSIYHSLRIATHLTFMGITDRDLITAALWHDVKEDLPDLWARSKDSLSQQVVSLVDAATKAKGSSIDAKITEEERLVNDELATVIHLYEAALSNPQAILLKEEDVIDNAPTYDSMPVNTREQRMKRDRKVQRFLWVFYPLLRSTHGPIIANRIAETSLRLQFPERYSQIQRQMASEQEEFERITNRDTFEALYDRSTQLEAEAYLPNITRLPVETDDRTEPVNDSPTAEAYYDVIDPRYLTPPVIQILSRDIVNIYRGDYHPSLRFPTLPFIKIIYRNNNEKAYWLNYLITDNKRTEIIHDDDGKIRLTIPLTTNGQPNSELEIEVELSTIEAEILPVDMYRDLPDDNPASPAIRTLAAERMAKLTDAYRQAKEEEDPRPVLSEHLLEGSVYFLTPENERYTVPRDSTYLDAISAIGKNLPISTVAVLVLENGYKKLVSMGDTIKPGQQIEAITREMLAESTISLEKLLELTGEDEKLQDELEEMIAGFSPSRFDMITTDRARRLISNRLKTLEDDESMRRASRKRARKIAARIYQLMEDQHRRFDQFIADGFTGALEEKYDSLDTLLERIGQIPIPLREDFMDHFERPELTFKIDKDIAMVEAITDLNQLVDNLLEFRRRLPAVTIRGLPNRTGELKNLGELSDKYGFDVLPMRASANDEGDDGIKRADIELVLRDFHPERVDAFLAEARDIFPAAAIGIHYPK